MSLLLCTAMRRAAAVIAATSAALLTQKRSTVSSNSACSQQQTQLDASLLFCFSFLCFSLLFFFLSFQLNSLVGVGLFFSALIFFIFLFQLHLTIVLSKPNLLHDVAIECLPSKLMTSFSARGIAELSSGYPVKHIMIHVHQCQLP